MGSIHWDTARIASLSVSLCVTLILPLLVLDAPYLSLITLGMDPYATPGHLEFYCLFTFLLTALDCHLSGMEFLIYLYAIVSCVDMWVSQVCVDNNLAYLIQFNISAHGEQRRHLCLLSKCRWYHPAAEWPMRHHYCVWSFFCAVDITCHTGF